jgi:hypothetical protein
MTLAPSVSEILAEHVTLQTESIDRMYLNVYVPSLQYDLGVVSFFRFHRGQAVASSALMGQMSRRFVNGIADFAKSHRLKVVSFEKGQRKEEVAKAHLARFSGDEGVFLVGRAQEKAKVFRTERRFDRKGVAYPWIVRSTAIVNHFYFYCLDRDFGPFFLKFCTYFPYTAKVCLNGHEYVKQQLKRRGISFEALDNGLLTCADPITLQQLCDKLSAETIEALVRKWLRLLPHPFSRKDRAAGYRYEISILQAEFSLTQVLDRPQTGRLFFEQVIRENLDVGRPDHVQLIFDRRVSRRTPGRFRTRVITQGVTPSLHLDYKHCRIKQYHKEGRALRTETTINDASDFKVGKRLRNLPRLREIGFRANRRLLDVERIGFDPTLGEDALVGLQLPAHVGAQRVSALRFGDPRVHALLNALVSFSLQTRSFSAPELREQLAGLLDLRPDEIRRGRLTYELRRLRLRRLIERLPGSHRYRVTNHGLRLALFLTRAHARLMRPGLATILTPQESYPSRLRSALNKLEAVMANSCREAQLAA